MYIALIKTHLIYTKIQQIEKLKQFLFMVKNKSFKFKLWKIFKMVVVLF